MARKLRPLLLAGLIVLTVIYLHLSPLVLKEHSPILVLNNHALAQQQQEDTTITHRKMIGIRHVTSLSGGPTSPVSVLLPDWEVLVITHDLSSQKENYTCLYPNDDVSSARPAGTLDRNRRAFKCGFPQKLRRRPPFPQPVLITTDDDDSSTDRSHPSGLARELLRWDRLVYDSLTTEDDVILFVKGINRRQNSYRAPDEFRCVFGDNSVIRTVVTSSSQEVFRCKLPTLNAVTSPAIKVSLEIPQQGHVVPSVAYYTPRHKIVNPKPKSLLCACTMVYNAAKFLKEWVIYHSSIGLEKFILYDNNSDDELQSIVEELNQRGYDVTTLFWIWPKTQEAGFSHCAMYAKDMCTWIMYTDIDEFVYSPTWNNSSSASPTMLTSILPGLNSKNNIGQLTIDCHEFGPSNQKAHPITGVTQGYNCRRRIENRHKSIVLLDAIDDSLLNVIHHFKLKEEYRSTRLRKDELVVNHYKYQAWSEFRNKFRRRVSAYVADWTNAVNPSSKDRAPGLGFSAVEPEGWTEKFCEIRDDRLKFLTRKWFTVEDKMPWQ